MSEKDKRGRRNDKLKIELPFEEAVKVALATPPEKTKTAGKDQRQSSREPPP